MPRILPTSKSKVSIGGVTDDVASLAQFTSDTYVLVSGVTNIGTFGDRKQVITSDWIAEGRTKKAMGTANAGTLELTADKVTADPGQEALLAAALTDDRYNFKIETPVGGGLFETDYVTGFVVTGAKNLGGANTVQSRAFTIELDEAPLTVDAA